MSIAGLLNRDAAFQIGVEALIRSIVGDEKVGIILVLVDADGHSEMTTNFINWQTMADVLRRSADEAEKGPDLTIPRVTP